MRTHTIEKNTLPETKVHENWEEEAFWAIDGLLARAVSGILIFTVLYLLAHIINRAAGI